jgi:carboxypeptidase family protein/TonB-dependent receptor-like protein
MKLNFRSTSIRCLLSVCLVGLLLAAASPAWSQESTGAITGTVTDSSGAPINGATVTARDVARDVLFPGQTNNDGSFYLSNVPPGRYEVKVEAKGFQTAAYPAFELVLNQTARVEIQMKVGEMSQTVEVSGEAPLLQTDSTQLDTLIDSRTAVALPLSTGNINQLTLLAPGVVTPNLFGFQAAQNTFGTGRPYVNGAREQENNFILDGMDNNQPDNNDVAYVPAPDAIQEFNLITINAPADFGNYLGGVVNVSIKSGTNQYHGDVYEYFRNSGLNANSWSNNANDIPRPGLHYNRFGGTFGGPIMKNKLFFFADYQESLYSQPSTITQLTTLSTANRTGDFSALCTAGFTGGGLCNNPAQQLFNPFSSGNPTTRAPFLNNQIPVGIFNSSSSSIINSPLYPSDPVALNVQRFTTNSYQGDLKMDYILSEKDHIMGRWSQQHVTAPTTNSIGLLGDASKNFPLENFVLDWSHAFSSSLLNDARVGFAYFPVTEGFSNPTGQDLPSVFGIGGVNSTFLPALNFSGAIGVIGNNDLVQSFHDTTMQFGDTITWTHGRHVIHTGFEFYHYIMNDLYPGNAGLAGQFTFNGQFTGNTGTTGGSPIADFLLGLPEDVQQGNGGGGNKYLRNNLFGAFVQDNWRLTSHLTLNLGLRYELTTARHTDNGEDVNFNLITGVPHIGSGYNTYTGIDNVQPRIGFAWQPQWDWAKNTVVRGAYGISSFMEANGVNNLPYQNPPFVEAHEVSFSGQALPTTTLDQGFTGFPSAACTAAALAAFSPDCLSGATLHLTNPNLRPAVDQQWNLTIQRQFGNHTTIQAAYVGNKIDHMSDIFIYNQNQLENGVVVPGPFAQPLINCCGTGHSPTIRFNDSSGIQRYNALQISVVQRFSRGLQFQANYTWSKCLSNSLGYFGQFGDEEALPGTTSQTNSSFFFQNAYDPHGDYGRCISDVASAFNGYVTYELPFGHGKQFAGDASGPVNALIGGWSIASNVTLHSGFAINPSAPDQSGTNSSGATRPNCVPGVSKYGSGHLETIAGVTGFQFLNPAAVSLPAPGTFGNCGEGSFRGPSLTVADLDITKIFPITERMNVQFMTQFINITNTPIFGAPNASCSPLCNGQIAPSGTSGAGAFGFISSSNPGRQIQFALKFNF